MVAIFFIISVVASTIGAISGIGGGVIIKPVLDATGLLSVSTISFMSGTTVLIMATVSLIRSSNNGVQLDKRHSTPLAIGAALGGIAGKAIFDFVREAVAAENLLGAVQAALLLLITVGVFVYVKYKHKVTSHHVKNILVCLGIGLLLGMISAFLGIGGGPINIAVLYFLFSMDAKTSAKNSLYVIWFSQVTSLVLTIATGAVPEFSWPALVLMGAGGVIGAIVGSHIVKRVNDQTVERVFMGLMLVIMSVNVYNIIRFLG